jgi:hypothetical protein
LVPKPSELVKNQVMSDDEKSETASGAGDAPGEAKAHAPADANKEDGKDESKHGKCYLHISVLFTDFF